MSAVIDIGNGQGDRRSRGLAAWSWLRRVLLPADAGSENQRGRRDAPVAVPHGSSGTSAGDNATRRRGSERSQAKAGVILPFPIHGEALLVKLAEVLRSRIADRGPEWDPLLPQLSRRPWSRLSIDRHAYIEFHDDRGEYCAVIEASPGTRVVLETVDFDVVVDFVLQYVAGRLAEPTALEAAS